MKLARNWSIAVAMLLVGFSSRPVLAISPTAVMVYGEKLGQPILLRPASPADFPAFGLLWWKAGSYARPNRTVQGEPELLSALKNRPYVNLAIFWGPFRDPINSSRRTPVSTGAFTCRRPRNQPSSL